LSLCRSLFSFTCKEQFLRIFILLAALIGPAAWLPADARPPGREHDAALRAMQEGRILPLRAIENMVVPRMRGFNYLGPELDVASGRYRLKFMRGPQVIWIDVDGRNGQIIGQSGN
jgi:hypothetical protein